MEIKKGVNCYQLPKCDFVGSIWVPAEPDNPKSPQYKLMEGLSLDFMAAHAPMGPNSLPFWFYFDDLTGKLYLSPAPHKDMNIHVTLLHKEII